MIRNGQNHFEFTSRIVTGLIVCLATLVASASNSAIAESSDPRDPVKPNFVLIFIDDMGWGDFSCFGNKQVETQNIDRMAKEGVRFHQFYVNSPICSPSRVAISTGMYPQRYKIGSFLASRKHNADRGIANWLDPKAPMLARHLQKAGYATGHFGKWHMGGQRDVGDAPLISEYGFDESLTNFEGLGDRVLPLKDTYDGKPAKKHPLGSDRLGRGKITWQNRDQVTASFTDAAIRFIRKSQSDGKPFYVNVWPDDVHSPFFPPKNRRGDGQKKTLYHGVLDTMDEQLGKLFDLIRDDEELRDNTLVLICSDNGPERGAGSAGPFRGFKTHLYEGGIRSPLIVWGPGMMKSDAQGTINDQTLIAAFDLVPSILNIAKVRPVGSPYVVFDGVDLSGSLLGRSTKSRKRPIFFRRPPDRDSFYGVKDLPDLAVRAGRWKLYCEFDGSQTELYDLESDRAETKNVADAYPRIVLQLKVQLLHWHQTMPQDYGKTISISRNVNRTANSISLFDGKSFSGWEGDTKHTWRIEDGTIVVGSKDRPASRNEFLATTKKYSDFDLSLKFKIDGDHQVNAGIQFRTERIPDHHEVIGYQADIGPGYDGHLYDESRRRRMLATPDKQSVERALKATPASGWIHYRIIAEGDRIRLWLNGVKMVDYVEKDKKIPRTGVIALQIHGGMKATIAYKDIVIKELKTPPQNSKKADK